MNESKQILKFAAGILLAMGIVGVSFLIYNNSKTSINSSMNQYSNLTSQYDNITYSQYENGTAKGDEVIRLINNLPTASDGVSIVVKTKGNTSGKVYTSNSCTIVADINDDDYINPNGVFACTIGRNTNGVISSVTFTQK